MGFTCKTGSSLSFSESKLVPAESSSSSEDEHAATLSHRQYNSTNPSPHKRSKAISRRPGSRDFSALRDDSSAPAAATSSATQVMKCFECAQREACIMFFCKVVLREK